MKYQDIQRDIEAGKLAACFFFSGQETYCIDTLTALIIKKAVVPETRDFNCDVLQAEEADISQVLAAAASFPMMAERRLVVLKNIQRLSPAEKDSLLAYVKRPCDTTCLVLTAGKIDGRQSFYKSLALNAVSADFKPLREYEAVPWVESLFQGRGVRISREAARLMMAITGSSLWNLTNEAEKMLTYCWGKKDIQVDDVNAVAGYSRKYNTWDLTDSVGRRQFGRAVDVLQRLMQEKASAPGLIMALAERIALLTRIRARLDKKEPSDGISASLGLNPYAAKMILEQAGCHTAAELEAAGLSLLRADEGIKTGALDPLLAVTMAVHDMVCGGERGRFFS